MSNERLNSIIDRLIASKDNGETRDIYADWAASYDTDLDGFGYVAPQTGVKLLVDLVPNKSAALFDVGCGTGLVGQKLAQAGFTNIEGGDFSADMLEKASALNVYRQLHAIDLMTVIPLRDNAYDAAICIGVYSSRFKENFFREIVRILKSKAPFVVSIRPHYFEDDVKPQLDTMVAKQIITDLTISNQPYMNGQAASAFYITFRKT
ncbi:MAG: class I SAM-dependent methyltransferase [Chloroflexota bacterium]